MDDLTENCAGCDWPVRVCERPCCTTCEATNGWSHVPRPAELTTTVPVRGTEQHTTQEADK